MDRKICYLIIFNKLIKKIQKRIFFNIIWFKLIFYNAKETKTNNFIQ